MRNNPQEIIDRMLHNGEAMLAAGRADQAFETYMEIVRLCPDPTAQYNLGVLSAQGRGTEQSFLEAAYWFYQVSLDGDQEAGDRCRQCMVKYIVQHMNQDTPRALYERMAHFAFYVYRGQDIRTLANKELFSLGAYYYKTGRLCGCRKAVPRGGRVRRRRNVPELPGQVLQSGGQVWRRMI